MKKLAAVCAVVVLGVGIAGAILFNSDVMLSDIRPDSMGAEGSGTPVMHDLGSAHGGLARWMAMEEVSVVLKGEWVSQIPHQRMAPFLGEDPHISMTFRPSVYGDAVIEVLDGGKERFEVRGGRSVRDTPTGEQPGPETLGLFVDSIRHLVEMPFAMQSADVQRSMPDASWRGQPHKRVFATWNTDEPQAKVDQYLLWQDKETGLLDRFDATARFAMPFATAFVTLEDHTVFDAFHIPGTMTVHRGGTEDDVLMRWRVVSVEISPSGGLQ